MIYKALALLSIKIPLFKNFFFRTQNYRLIRLENRSTMGSCSQIQKNNYEITKLRIQILRFLANYNKFNESCLFIQFVKTFVIIQNSEP